MICPFFWRPARSISFHCGKLEMCSFPYLLQNKHVPLSVVYLNFIAREHSCRSRSFMYWSQHMMIYTELTLGLDWAFHLDFYCGSAKFNSENLSQEVLVLQSFVNCRECPVCLQMRLRTTQQIHSKFWSVKPPQNLFSDTCNKPPCVPNQGKVKLLHLYLLSDLDLSRSRICLAKHWSLRNMARK